MTGKSSLMEGLLRANERSRAKVFEMRRENPHLYVGKDAELIFIENVADLLTCGVDKVRRIPRSDLPAVKIGKRLQYFRGDVLAYAKNLRDTGTTRVPGSGKQRGPTKPRIEFDPVEMLKSRLPTRTKA